MIYEFLYLSIRSPYQMAKIYLQVRGQIWWS